LVTRLPWHQTTSRLAAFSPGKTLNRPSPGGRLWGVLRPRGLSQFAGFRSKDCANAKGEIARGRRARQSYFILEGNKARSSGLIEQVLGITAASLLCPCRTDYRRGRAIFAHCRPVFSLLEVNWGCDSCRRSEPAPTFRWHLGSWSAKMTASRNPKGNDVTRKGVGRRDPPQEDDRADRPHTAEDSFH